MGDSHVLHTGLGLKLELTKNEALASLPQGSISACRAGQRAFVGRPAMLLRGNGPTFSDVTLVTAIAFSKFPVNATPLDERLEFLDAYWQRWQQRPSLKAAFTDGNSGIPERNNRA